MNYGFQNYLDKKRLSNLIEQADDLTDGYGSELISAIIDNPNKDAFQIYNEFLGMGNPFHRPGGSQNPNWLTSWGSSTAADVYKHNAATEKKKQDMQQVVNSLGKIDPNHLTVQQVDLLNKANKFIANNQSDTTQGNAYKNYNAQYATDVAGRHGVQGSNINPATPGHQTPTTPTTPPTQSSLFPQNYQSTGQAQTGGSNTPPQSALRTMLQQLTQQSQQTQQHQQSVDNRLNAIEKVMAALQAGKGKKKKGTP